MYVYIKKKVNVFLCGQYRVKHILYTPQTSDPAVKQHELIIQYNAGSDLTPFPSPPYVFIPSGGGSFTIRTAYRCAIP